MTLVKRLRRNSNSRRRSLAPSSLLASYNHLHSVPASIGTLSEGLFCMFPALWEVIVKG